MALLRRRGGRRAEQGRERRAWNRQIYAGCPALAGRARRGIGIAPSGRIAPRSGGPGPSPVASRPHIHQGPDLVPGHFRSATNCRVGSGRSRTWLVSPRSTRRGYGAHGQGRGEFGVVRTNAPMAGKKGVSTRLALEVRDKRACAPGWSLFRSGRRRAGVTERSPVSPRVAKRIEQDESR